MNTKDTRTLHLDRNLNKKNSGFIAVLHFTVTVGSSTMNMNIYIPYNDREIALSL